MVEILDTDLEQEAKKIAPNGGEYLLLWLLILCAGSSLILGVTAGNVNTPDNPVGTKTFLQGVEILGKGGAGLLAGLTVVQICNMLAELQTSEGFKNIAKRARQRMTDFPH